MTYIDFFLSSSLTSMALLYNIPFGLGNAARYAQKQTYSFYVLLAYSNSCIMQLSIFLLLYFLDLKGKFPLINDQFSFS